jgi:hypothetical protein
MVRAGTGCCYRNKPLSLITEEEQYDDDAVNDISKRASSTLDLLHFESFGSFVNFPLAHTPVILPVDLFSHPLTT